MSALILSDDTALDVLPDEIVAIFFAAQVLTLPAAGSFAQLGRRYAHLWFVAPRRADVLRLCEPPFSLPRAVLLNDSDEASNRSVTIRLALAC
mgnify:CR=1 FL=1